MQLKKLVLAILSKLPIGYFNGQLYKLSLQGKSNANLELAGNQFKPKVLIVSRECYQEKLISLPVVDKREVKRLMSINAQNDNLTHYKINSVSENQSKLNTWHFSKKLPASWWYLPESVLLAQDLKDNQQLVVENTENQARLYLTQTTNGLVTSIPTAVINSIERFCQSSGVTNEGKIKHVKGNKLADKLINGLVKLTASDWQTFGSVSTASLNPKEFKKPVILTLTIVSSYFLISSAYIVWQQQSLVEQKGLGQADVVAAIELQDKITLLSSKVSRYAKTTDDFKVSAIIWQLLLPLYEKAQFSQIKLAENRFILQGQTNKATELLALISSVEGVSDAKFDLPVSANRQKERFTISFEWQRPYQGGSE